jgi:hypothetical protein
MAALFSYAFHAQDGTLVYDLPIDGAGEAPGFAVPNRRSSATPPSS